MDTLLYCWKVTCLYRNEILDFQIMDTLIYGRIFLMPLIFKNEHWLSFESAIFVFYCVWRQRANRIKMKSIIYYLLLIYYFLEKEILKVFLFFLIQIIELFLSCQKLQIKLGLS